MRLPHISSFTISASVLTVLFCAWVGTYAALAAVTYSCPTGLGATNSTTVGSSCYAYYNTTKTWSAAETACQGVGGHLASVRSSAANAAILGMATHGDVWIGASDDNAKISGASEGNYFWAGDSSAFFTGGFGGTAVGGAYLNWEPVNEPNNFGGSENCVEMYTSFNFGMWNDASCNAAFRYVCEIPALASGSPDPSSSSSSESPVHRSGGVREETLRTRMAIAALRWLLVTQPGSISMASATIINTPVMHFAAPSEPVYLFGLPQSSMSSSAKTSSASPVSSASPSQSSSRSSSISSSISSLSSISSSKSSAVSSSVKAISPAPKIIVSSVLDDQRIVASWRANLHADARVNAAVRLILTRTLKVKLLTIVDKDWAYVQIPSGMKGYVLRKNLTK